MRDSDYPLLGNHYWKIDRQQGQHNRSARDGEFLLPRIIEEFGSEPFSMDEFRDAFDAYVPTGTGDKDTGSRKLNVVAGLESLVDQNYIDSEGDLYSVTDLGRSFAEQLTESRTPWIDTENDD